MKRVTPIVVVMMLVAGCGGKSMARVKGRLVDNGAPFALPADSGEVGIAFTLLDDAGKPVPFKMYSAIVQADGTFEVVSSAGELEPGTYEVAIDAAKAKSTKFKPFEIGKSKVRTVFKPGENDIAIDMSKPNG